MSGIVTAVAITRAASSHQTQAGTLSLSDAAVDVVAVVVDGVLEEVIDCSGEGVEVVAAGVVGGGVVGGLVVGGLVVGGLVVGGRVVGGLVGEGRTLSVRVGRSAVGRSVGLSLGRLLGLVLGLVLGDALALGLGGCGDAVRGGRVPPP